MGRLELDHRRLVDSAAAGIKRDRATAEDDVLAGNPLWFLPDVELGLAAWLVAAFRLNLPESPATVDVDRREVGPTYFFARADEYDELRRQARSRSLSALGVR
jgi:long-chain acyl-CoA synthetase